MKKCIDCDNLTDKMCGFCSVCLKKASKDFWDYVGSKKQARLDYVAKRDDIIAQMNAEREKTNQFRKILSATTIVGFDEFMGIYEISEQDYTSACETARGRPIDEGNVWFGYWAFRVKGFVHIRIRQNGWRDRFLKVPSDLVLKTVVLGELSSDPDLSEYVESAEEE